VYAVVTSRREGRSGVQSLGKFSIKDLYYGAESPVIEFRDAIESIYQLCSDTLRRADDLVTLNTGAVKIWMLICELRSLLGKISSGHDEVMATLIAVAVKSKLEPIDAVRLRGLQAASGIVRNKVRFSVETLDAFEDALERAGFDLGIPLAEDGNG